MTDGRVDDPRQYAAVKGIRVATGRHIAVSIDRQVLSPDVRERAAEIVRLFERDIRPGMQATLGVHRDTDGDGRLTVLITPWLNRLQGGRTSVGGLVRSADLDSHGRPPFSNRCDLLFLNSAAIHGVHLKALLTHEYAHVVCFSHRAANNPDESPASMSITPFEEDWINEGVAHVCEHLQQAGWSNLDDRLQAFLAAPHKYPLTVPDYYTAGLWRNPGCRGATFLFFRWCAAQFGNAMLRELVHSPTTGIETVESATRQPFETLFRHWAVATFCSGKPDIGLRHSQDVIGGVTHGRIGRHRLTGPKPLNWTVSDERCRFSLRGSSVAYVELRPGTASGSLQNVVIEADADSRLQLTLLKLPGSSKRPMPSASE